MLKIRLLVLIISFISYYRYLLIFQQSHYHLKEFFSYYLKRFYIFLIPVLISLTFYVNKDLELSFLMAICLLCYEASLLRKPKLGLKITKRIERTMILSLIYFLLILYKPYLYIINFIIVSIIFLISNSLENIIRFSFLKKAVKIRTSYQGSVIAITGSYGKTTTKNFLETMLSDLNVVATKKSYNTPMGISKELNERDKKEILASKALILEMGLSQKGDIDYLAKHFKPDMAIITNIGFMHLNNFKDLKGILNEKLKITKYLKKGSIVILNNDDPYLKSASLRSDLNVITYSKTEGDLIYNKLSSDYFEVLYKGNKKRYPHLNLSDTDLANLMPSIILSYHFQLDETLIFNNILKLKRPRHRQEEKHYSNLTILDNAFNANINGSIEAILKMKQYAGLKYIITPGLVDQGVYKDINHQKLAQLIDDTFDYIFIMNSPSGRNLASYLNKNYYFINTFNDAFKIVFQKQEKRALLILNDLPEYYEDI